MTQSKNIITIAEYINENGGDNVCLAEVEALAKALMIAVTTLQEHAFGAASMDEYGNSRLDARDAREILKLIRYLPVT